jgi:hypothetical protein
MKIHAEYPLIPYNQEQAQISPVPLIVDSWNGLRQLPLRSIAPAKPQTHAKFSLGTDHELLYNCHRSLIPISHDLRGNCIDVYA